MKKQKGLSIIEAMVSVSLLSVLMLATAHGISTSFKTTKREIRDSEALQLALEKMEQLAAIDPSTLTAAESGTEALTVDSIAFSRVTTVTVNADTSRTVQVQVTSTEQGGGNVSLSNTFALWGNA